MSPRPSGPRPHLAGSQNLLQVQVPREVECASLRLVEVPRDVAVAGKRVTGVRPPVVLHSVSQTSISVPKTLMRLKTGFSRAGLEWRRTGETSELTEAAQDPTPAGRRAGGQEVWGYPSLPLLHHPLSSPEKEVTLWAKQLKVRQARTWNPCRIACTWTNTSSNKIQRS